MSVGDTIQIAAWIDNWSWIMHLSVATGEEERRGGQWGSKTRTVMISMQNACPVLVWKMEGRRNNVARSFIKELSGSGSLSLSLRLVPRRNWRFSLAEDGIKIFRAFASPARKKETEARVTKHEESSYFTIYLLPGRLVEMAHLTCHEFVPFYARTLRGRASNFTAG